MGLDSLVFRSEMSFGHFGTGAKMSGHFGPIWTVPICLWSEVFSYQRSKDITWSQCYSPTTGWHSGTISRASDSWWTCYALDSWEEHRVYLLCVSCSNPCHRHLTVYICLFSVVKSTMLHTNRKKLLSTDSKRSHCCWDLQNNSGSRHILSILYNGLRDASQNALSSGVGTWAPSPPSNTWFISSTPQVASWSVQPL